MTPDRLTDERLAELERLCAEATPGPWRTSREDMESYALDESGEWGHVVYIYRPDGHRMPVFGERAREDARFIVAARAALPALIAEVRALRRVAEAAERDVTDAKAQCGYHADVPRCYGPQYKRHCTDCPYEVVRETDMALAEWRRVRDLPEREGSGDGGGA